MVRGSVLLIISCIIPLLQSMTFWEQFSRNSMKKTLPPMGRTNQEERCRHSAYSQRNLNNALKKVSYFSTCLNTLFKLPSLPFVWGFPGGLVVKNPPPNTGDAGRGLDPWVRKIPRSREWLPTSSILVWEIPTTGEPGRLQSIGSQRIRHDWATEHAHPHMYSSLWIGKAELFAWRSLCVLSFKLFFFVSSWASFFLS